MEDDSLHSREYRWARIASPHGDTLCDSAVVGDREPNVTEKNILSS